MGNLAECVLAILCITTVVCLERIRRKSFEQ